MAVQHQIQNFELRDIPEGSPGNSYQAVNRAIPARPAIPRAADPFTSAPRLSPANSTPIYPGYSSRPPIEDRNPYNQSAFQGTQGHAASVPSLQSSNNGHQTAQQPLSMALPGTHNHVVHPSRNNNPPPLDTYGEWGAVAIRSNVQYLITWLFGLAVALAHHFMYESLDGKRTGGTHRQRLVLGTGIALAMVVKYCFLLVIQHAIVQHIWKALRGPSYQLRSIDSLFNGTESLAWLYRSELWRKAEPVLGLLSVFWIFKLLTVAPPTTFTVVQGGALAGSVEHCNATTMNLQPDWPGINIRDSLPFTYYDGNKMDENIRLSSLVSKIAVASVYSGDVILPRSPCGDDCAYNVTFYALAYVCEATTFAESPFAEDSLKTKWQTPGEVGTRKLYDARAVGGDFWVAYSYLRPGIRNESSLEGRDRDIDRLGNVTDNDYLRQAVNCSDWNASYDATLSYSGTGSTIKINRRVLANEIHYEKPEAAKYLEEPNKALHLQIASWLQGNITLNITKGGNAPKLPSSLIIGSTRFVNSAVPFGDEESEYFYPLPNLHEALEELHMNISLSFLSASPRSYFILRSEAECSVYHQVNIFFYNPLWLLGTYFPAALITLLIHIAGLICMRKSGYEASTSFSTVMATTQNKKMEDVLAGNSLGRQPLTSQLLQAKVSFGDVADPSATVSSFAFGQNVEKVKRNCSYK